MCSIEEIDEKIQEKGVEVKECTECGNETWDIEILKLPIMVNKQECECIGFTCKKCGYLKFYNIKTLLK